MPHNPPKLFILLPCYNEEEVLPKTYEVLSKKLSSLIQRGLVAGDSSMVFVDDGSKDGTWEVLKTLVSQNLESQNPNQRKRIQDSNQAKSAEHEASVIYSSESDTLKGIELRFAPPPH